MTDIVNVINLLKYYIEKVNYQIKIIRKENNNKIKEKEIKLKKDYEKYLFEYEFIKSELKKFDYIDLLKIDFKSENYIDNNNLVLNYLNIETVNYLKYKLNKFKELINIDNKYEYFYYNNVEYDKNIKLKLIKNDDIKKFLFYEYIKKKKNIKYEEIISILDNDFSYYIVNINNNIININKNIEEDLFYKFYKNIIKKQDIIYENIINLDNIIENNLNEINKLDNYINIDINNIEKVYLEIKNEKYFLLNNSNFKILIDEIEKIEKNILENENGKYLLDIKISNKKKLIEKLYNKININNINKKTKIVRIQNIDDMNIKNKYLLLIDNLKNKDNSTLLYYKYLIDDIYNKIKEIKKKIKKNELEIENYKTKIIKIEKANIPKVIKIKYDKILNDYKNNKKNIELCNDKLGLELNLDYTNLKIFKKKYKKLVIEMNINDENIKKKRKKYEKLIKKIDEDIKNRNINKKVIINREEIENLNKENNLLNNLGEVRYKILKIIDIDKNKIDILENKLNSDFNIIYSSYKKIEYMLKLIENVDENIRKKKEYINNILTEDNIIEKLDNLYSIKYIKEVKISIEQKYSNDNMNIYIEKYINFLDDFIKNMYNMNNYYNLKYFLNNKEDIKEDIFDYEKYNKTYDKLREKCKLYFNKLNEELLIRLYNLGDNFCKISGGDRKEYNILIKKNKLLYKYEIEYKKNNNSIKIINKYIKKYSVN